MAAYTHTSPGVREPRGAFYASLAFHPPMPPICTYCETEAARHPEYDAMWLCPSCGATYDGETWTSKDWQEGSDLGFEAGLEEGKRLYRKEIREQVLREVARGLHEEVGLTQAAVAKAVGLHQSTISRILSGPKEPSVWRKGYGPD